MPHHEDPAHRVPEPLGGEGGMLERAMFGGPAFLLRGNLAAWDARSEVDLDARVARGVAFAGALPPKG